MWDRETSIPFFYMQITSPLFAKPCSYPTTEGRWSISKKYTNKILTNNDKVLAKLEKWEIEETVEKEQFKQSESLSISG